MALSEQGDWGVYVEREVDALVADIVGRSELEGRSGLVRVDDPEGPEAEAVRARLISFSRDLLAAAAAGTGTLQCDDGHNIVDCQLFLRPGKAPYYRCVGHAPPHCYAADYSTTQCP